MGRFYSYFAAWTIPWSLVTLWMPILGLSPVLPINNRTDYSKPVWRLDFVPCPFCIGACTVESWDWQEIDIMCLHYQPMTHTSTSGTIGCSSLVYIYLISFASHKWQTSLADIDHRWAKTIEQFCRITSHYPLIQCEVFDLVLSPTLLLCYAIMLSRRTTVHGVNNNRIICEDNMRIWEPI